MKKIMASVLAAAMIMGVGTATTFTGADTVLTASASGKFGSLEYDIYEGYVRIQGFDNSVSELEIPSEIEGTPVTIITGSAFKGASLLESVVIPEGITKIGQDAFKGCTSLKNVSFPSTLKGIDARAFNNCISLEEIEIPKGTSYVGDNVFGDCTNLRTVTINNGISSINKTFPNCNLATLYIPKSVIDIHTNAFMGGSVQDVYYEGSPEQWNAIEGIKYLKDVNIHYGAENLPVRRTADLNADGVLDASDASIILAYYAYTMTGGTGTIEEFLAK